MAISPETKVLPIPLCNRRVAAAGYICPFQVHAPDEMLADLRRWIAATKWPEAGNRGGCVAGRQK
jgi:hypothetical protein